MDCCPSVAPTIRQHPASVLPVMFDFGSRALANCWESAAEVSPTYRVRPAIPNGYEYEATAGGQTGWKEPIWPKVLGATITDGSVVWTCRAISTQSLSSTVSSVAWSSDSGIVISDEVLQGQLARAMVSGGTDGQTYRITAEATCSDGKTIVGEVFVEVTVAAARQACSS